MGDLFKVIYNATGSGHYKTILAEDTIPEGYKEKFRGTKEESLKYISDNPNPLKPTAPFKFGSVKQNTHNIQVFSKFTI